MAQNAPTKTETKNAESSLNTDIDSLQKRMEDCSMRTESQIDGIQTRQDELGGGVVTVKFEYGDSKCNCLRFPSKTFNGVKRTDPLGPLFEKFTEDRSRELPYLNFLYEGRRFGGEHTPDSAGVELDEKIMEIEVYRSQPCELCYPYEPSNVF